MLNKIFKKDKKNLLNIEIENVMKRLMVMDPEGEDYKPAVENLKRLYEVKALERGNKVSKDVLAVGAFSLASTVLVLYFERFGVVTSKAFQYILRSRV